MQLDRELLEVISSIKNLDDLESFFEEIMTPAELVDISLRWRLLVELHQGVAQRKIAEKFGISLCKITRGSRILKKKGSVALNILNELYNRHEAELDLGPAPSQRIKDSDKL